MGIIYTCIMDNHTCPSGEETASLRIQALLKFMSRSRGSRKLKNLISNGHVRQRDAARVIECLINSTTRDGAPVLRALLDTQDKRAAAEQKGQGS